MYKLLFIVSILLISCGPSLEQIEAYEKAKKDSIEANNAVNNTLKENKSNSVKFYYSNELGGLPTGTLIAFAPTDEDITNKSENGICSEPIYASILHEDGSITIHETTYKVWLNVYTNSIIK